MTTLIPKFEQTGTSINRPISEKLAQLPNQGDFADFAAMETYAATLTSPSDMAVKPGTSVRTLTSVLQESISIKDFGAKGDGTTDDTVAIQAALTYASTTTRGAAIHIPAGTYKITATLNIYKSTLLYGDGRQTSIFTYNGTGDGIKSSYPINSSQNATIVLRDFQITCTNSSNAGGGFDDIGGTFIELTNLKITGFKYNIILDQSELVRISNCDLESPITGGFCIWMVNGPDHTYTTSTSSVSTGTQTVTPVDMSIITASWNANGAGATYMWAENANKTNGEVIQITAVTSTTFTAVFGTSKSANFVIGARPGFTNQISVTGCQFNSDGTANHIVDDGGGNHYVAYNNFNGGASQFRGASVSSLEFVNNEMEQATTYCVYLGNTGYSGRTLNYSQAFNIQSNGFVGANVSVYLDQCQNGSIKNNNFIQYHLCGISIDFPDYMVDVEISNNGIPTSGQAITSLPLFIDSQVPSIVAQGKVNQKAQCYVSSALAATGSQTITPTTMQFITNGCTLQCRNIDGSNLEIVTVTAVTGSTFTAIFTTTKTAGWMINGYSA